jgi:hypothetical protein
VFGSGWGRDQEPPVNVDRGPGGSVVDSVKCETWVTSNSAAENRRLLDAHHLIPVPHCPLEDTVDVGQGPLYVS